MLTIIDDFLNNITQYRLVLYCLIFFLVVAAILSLFNFLPFNFISLIFSVSILVVICWITNKIFAKVFKVSANLESVYITALILALIITPAHSLQDVIFLGWAGLFSQLSKYILAINKKHIFNPAAFAVFLTSITINKSAGWWVGTVWMSLFVLAGGLLVVRKIRKFSLVLSFLLTFLAIISGNTILKGGDVLLIARRIILDTPVIFFAFIMLTEPQTTPPGKKLQIIYGGLVGLLFYFTPELALLTGNIFSYLASPKAKLVLKLKEKVQIAKDTYDFIFGLEKQLSFTPGQYMEWTLGHKNPDSRGNRRYFTLASSPTEDNLRIGVKFYPEGSSFKRRLLTMDAGGEIVAGQLAGDFTLPKDLNKKLVFMAGGIGITPFRSMIKYLLDTGGYCDIVLLYSNKTVEDIAYREILDQASKTLGIKIVYVLTDVQKSPGVNVVHLSGGQGGWTIGLIDEQMIKKEVPDFKERIFYISGPHSMVDAFEVILKNMGISKSQIKTDYFPGYA